MILGLFDPSEKGILRSACSPQVTSLWSSEGAVVMNQKERDQSLIDKKRYIQYMFLQQAEMAKVK